MASFWDLQNKNKLYSYLLVFFVFLILFSLFQILYFMFGDLGYFFLFLSISSIIYPIITYFYSDKIILFLTGAKPADPLKDMYLINVGEGLALAAGLAKAPKFYILEDLSPNAFATGRNPDNAVIAVTRGLLNMTNREELEGVLAHEISHIRNYDTLFMTLVVVMVGLIGFLSQIILRYSFFERTSRHRNNRRSSSGSLILIGILAGILAPIISRFIVLAISRRREYLADASAVQLTRNPEGLASALEKIKNSQPSSIDYGPARALFISDPNRSSLLETALEKIKNSQPSSIDSGPARALFISDPSRSSLLKDISNLFSTHPPIDERIKILRSM